MVQIIATHGEGGVVTQAHAGLIGRQLALTDTVQAQHGLDMRMPVKQLADEGALLTLGSFGVQGDEGGIVFQYRIVGKEALGHLFGSNVTRVAFKRGAWLRRYVVAFAEMLSPRLSPALIERAMQGEGTDFNL